MRTLDRSVLDRIHAGRLTMRGAIAGGQVRVSNGTPANVARFFAYFATVAGGRGSRARRRSGDTRAV
jgi:hypothetical protein